VAAALRDHGLDDEETIHLAHALAAFHSRVIPKDPDDWLAEAENFGGYMFAVGRVAGLDHRRRLGNEVAKPS
jgi:hypothetical protein